MMIKFIKRKPSYINTFGVFNPEVIDNFNGDILSANDYYPFGMAMASASYSSEAYRYGFQGQEKEDEFKGSGNSYTTELRQYDARIGRWLSFDPEDQYPSPYTGFGNNPLNGIDEDGGFFEELKNWAVGRGWVTNSAHQFMKQHGGTASRASNNVTEVSFKDYNDATGEWVDNKALFASKRRNAIKFENAYVIESKKDKSHKKGGADENDWGVTFGGSHIKVGYGQLDNTALIKHEYGHWIQYEKMGALRFYWKIGIPSFLNSIANKFKFGTEHHYHHVEVDANIKSKQYFGFTEGHSTEYPVDYSNVKFGRIQSIMYKAKLYTYSGGYLRGRVWEVKQRNVHKLNKLKQKYP